MTLPPHVLKNQNFWNRTSDDYQAKHGAQLDWRKDPVWGVWAIPESELRILGDVADKDVLEFGCGAAQWSIALCRKGARVVGIDISERQLDAARRLSREAGVNFPLLHASSEAVPLPDASFDIVFCDHGATTFSDPYASVPEAARLLRPNGLFAFNITTPILDICWDEKLDAVGEKLQHSYFGLHSIEDGKFVSFQLPYGEWIKLFRRSGFLIEDLLELKPPVDATTTYEDFVPESWARSWPAEHIWRLRKINKS